MRASRERLPHRRWLPEGRRKKNFKNLSKLCMQLTPKRAQSNHYYHGRARTRAPDPGPHTLDPMSTPTPPTILLHLIESNSVTRKKPRKTP